MHPSSPAYSVISYSCPFRVIRVVRGSDLESLTTKHTNHTKKDTNKSCGEPVLEPRQDIDESKYRAFELGLKLMVDDLPVVLLEVFNEDECRVNALVDVFDLADEIED